MKLPLLILIFSMSALSAVEIRVSGESRIRYESLDGQYRSGREGSDQLLPLRTLLKLKTGPESFEGVLEIHDARTYLDDEGSPLSTSFVNTHDVLQLHVDWLALKSPWLDQRFKIGRFTLDLGSRRFVERNDFRNTINSYTGVHGITTFANGWHLDAFYTQPVNKLPLKADRESLDDNDFDLDEQDTTRGFWGLHLQKIALPHDLMGDLFVYGLSEWDREEKLTKDRHVLAPGFRIHRKKGRGRWDMDLEFALRRGQMREGNTLASKKLDVEAHMLHIEAGYTFDHPWNPRINLEYDLASGDDDPNDDVYGRYDRFYGTRRGDMGNTSIHGPLTRSNVSVPGIRFSFKKDRLDGRFIVQQANLDSSRDAWVVAGLTDAKGASGDHIGDTFDGRVRYWIKPQHLRGEVGGSWTEFGDFAEQVAGGPDANRARFAYVMLTAYF